MVGGRIWGQDEGSNIVLCFELIAAALIADEKGKIFEMTYKTTLMDEFLVFSLLFQFLTKAIAMDTQKSNNLKSV